MGSSPVGRCPCPCPCPSSRAAPPPPTRWSASGPSRSPPSSSPRSISRATPHSAGARRVAHLSPRAARHAAGAMAGTHRRGAARGHADSRRDGCGRLGAHPPARRSRHQTARLQAEHPNQAALFQSAGTGRFTKFSETVEELKKDLPGAEDPGISQVPGQPETAVLTAPIRQARGARAGDRD